MFISTTYKCFYNNTYNFLWLKITEQRIITYIKPISILLHDTNIAVLDVSCDPVTPPSPSSPS